jgi:hypothetical protein
MSSRNKWLVVFAGAFLLSPISEAGIIRHVVRPVVRAGAKIGVKTAKVGAHVAKTVVY